MNTFVTLWLPAITVALYYGVGMVWEYIRRRLIAKHTIWYDTPRLGQKRLDSAKIPGIAVICGGSVGGLFAARVCSDHFERVVIIEPESWLTTEDGRRTDSWNQENKRARVMQYDSSHAFQNGLYRILKQVFGSRLSEECVARDIQVAEMDFQSHNWGIPTKDPRVYFGGKLPTILWAGRRGLETLLRHLTLDKTSYPNIEQVVGTLTGFILDPTRPGRLRGVTYRDAEGCSHDMDAVLVVDSSGSTQGGVKWLKRLGLAQDVKKRTYDPKMHPSPELGRQLPIPGGFDKKDGGGIITCLPLASLDHRFFAMHRVDGHHIWVGCGGWGASIEAPRNIDNIIDYARSLKMVQPLPEWVYQVLEVLRGCEDSMVSNRVTAPASYWTQYHTCPDLPSNFVALGDAAARLNPVYAQGVIESFYGGVCINNLLDTSRVEASLPPDFSRNFFKMQADKINLLWAGPKTIDYLFSTTTPEEGETLKSGAFLRKYMSQLSDLCTEDAYINFLCTKNVALMDTAPIDFFHPRVMYRVLKHWARILVKY